MKQRARLSVYAAIGGCFLLVDQAFKYFARNNPDFSYHIVDPWLGWELFLNPGIAFSLPFPNMLLVILTPIVVFGLGVYLVRHIKKAQSWGGQHDWLTFGLLLIIFGATSNYVDRLVFAVTIDYLRILTSVINIADVMIVSGAILLLIPQRKDDNLDN